MRTVQLARSSWPIFVLLMLVALDANAAINSVGLMDGVLQKFKDNASQWAAVFEQAATRLFWALAIISMVWTFGLMALRKADLGEFFVEFIRFTITTGFFWWALTNGPAFAASIVESLKQLGGNASSLTGFASSFTPSSIVDIGFIVLGKALDESSGWSPVDSFIGVLLALAVLVLMTLIAVNMLLLLISGWILGYAGIFFLGFGGSRWTSDMAINYYKTVLGIAAQIMGMILLIGIGRAIIFDYYANMEKGIVFMEMAIMVVVALVLFILTNKIPSLISGIITGASVGGAGIGTFGAGAAMGAAGMAAAAVATGGAAMAAGAANISGGAQSLMAAFKAAQGNVAAGSDVTSRLAGAMGGGDSSQGGSSSLGSSDGPTPMASAMGLGDAGSAGGSSLQGGGGSSGGASSGSAEGGGEESSGSSSAGESTPGAGEQSASSGAGSNTGTGESSQSSSKMGTAGRVAADMAAQLAGGVGRSAKEKASQIAGSAKERIANTSGGRLAQEISNPGAKTQERMDNQVIAQAEQKMAASERSEKAAEARNYLSGVQTPSFDGDAIGSVNADDEIAAFRDRKTT